ncbi:anti-virulence regulator CigR family protein [Pseudomonas indica]|uniref:Nickel/cobalt transporter regulator n=1 Tax=Pseudomonas indica TaxID=137658 RepID=A0A1G8Z0G2_9PSED|nr:anti-virulence regulator CigR family protein [Pseudomonas indica]SDK08526.1 Nickel/cobalt transporter regulator [Pseudomonas indica]
MLKPSRFALLGTGLALILSAQPGLAAPKHDKGSHQGGHDSSGASIQVSGPTIDIGRVRIVLGENRNLIGPTTALPPGVSKNLERGKPLPPGIAKNFDGRVQSQLPHYDGYEWKQVGRDVVLVAIATGIVYEVLRNVLD